MDCTYRPNDVVPIVGRISGFSSVFVSSLSSPVGCALAGLVLMVLVAYLVGEQARLESMNDEHDHCIFLSRSKKEPREGLPECLKNLY